MQIGRIEGCTRVLGKSQGYLGLPLRDVVISCTVNGPDTPAMETAWFPTPDEIAAIVAGAPVILRVLGAGHPPVMLYTGSPPVDETKERGLTAAEQKAQGTRCGCRGADDYCKCQNVPDDVTLIERRAAKEGSA